MAELRTAHTADLDAATLTAARTLLDGVFEGDLTDHDWEHALGGVPAMVWEEAELIGHASVIQRRLLHGGRALRTGYVEGVGVRADRRRRGHATAMLEVLARVVRGTYDLGALGATDAAAAFYAARGWLARWRRLVVRTVHTRQPRFLPAGKSPRPRTRLVDVPHLSHLGVP